MSDGEPIIMIATDTLGTILGGISYGFHAAFFLLFLVIHRSRGTKAYSGSLNKAIIFLFTLCTGVVIVKIWQTFYEITRNHENARTNLNSAFSVFYALIDLVTQLSLIYRCWIIWERRRYIIVLPLLLTFASFGAQLAFIVFPLLPVFNFNGLITSGRAAFALSLGVNTLVMFLIISRIWFITGQIARFIPQGSRRRDRAYRIIMAILLESGLVIFVGQLCWTVLFALDNPGLDVIEDLVTQLYGMTPLILMIRVTLGVSYDSETKIPGSLVFASQPKETSHLSGVENSMPHSSEISSSKLEKGGIDL